MKIIPLISPDIDMDAFVKACSEVLNYSPLSGIDQSTRQFSDPAKFLAGLAGFHNKINTKTPISAIRDAASLCSHLFYSFLVAATKSTILKSMERTELHHTVAEDLDDLQLTVISGTLTQWKQATLECCHADSSHQLRLLYDGFFLYFEKQGLGELWFDTLKKKAPKNTFYLEAK